MSGAAGAHATQLTTHILVVTGASGAGKTATVQALEARGIAGVRCFYFDSIGVPSSDVMVRNHGGVEQWQEAATVEWLARLSDLPSDVTVAVLDGQVRPSFVVGAKAHAASRSVHAVLLDCAADVRADRLHVRRQPQLANARMDQWAAYLRGQADAFRLPVIDTTLLTVAEAAEKLNLIVRELVEPGNP
jgi:hypothetical protein